jgi:nucleotide-binding universal stress UspA family protein
MNAQHQGAVVIGVDESVFSGQALRWAAEQASLEGRRLLLANASGPVNASWGDHSMDHNRHGSDLLDRARAAVASIDVEVDEVFEVTDPATLLIDLSHSAHLVVLGSRGRGPVRSHLLGSIGLRVLRHAGCPVVVHRPGHPGRVRRGVVVASDASERSLEVVAFAFAFASLRRLPLKVVHYRYDARRTLAGSPLLGVPAVGIPMPVAPVAADPTYLAEEDALALAESMAGLREQYPDVHVTVETVLDLPEHGLPPLSASADLVVLGSHQRTLLGRIVEGSVSTVVLEHAHGPVAVVPVPPR